MSATGYIQVHAFTGNGRIPLENVAVTVTDGNNKVLAMRLTDESGSIAPIPVTVPERSASQSPGTPGHLRRSISMHGWKITSRLKTRKSRSLPAR